MIATADAYDTAGRSVYAIGDIHGRDDLFEMMLARIDDDLAAAPVRDRPMLVLLGDYVDRGPASRQVIERVLALEADGRFELRCLLGNHEEAMLDFLDRKTSGPGWLKHGGGATMLSYGVRAPASEADRAAWSAARDALRKAVPEAHVRFLRGLELMIEVGAFLFVHAGLRPGVALAEQSQRDMLWIRNSFLEVEHGFGKTIVHGHTPVEQAFVSALRIGLDTGAYASGTLTAVRLDGGMPRLLQARIGSGGRAVPPGDGAGGR